MFFDTDLTLMKNFRIPHWEGAQFQIGAPAFNILNHPNSTRNEPKMLVGGPTVFTMLPNAGLEMLLTGWGGDSSPRALQIRAQLAF